MLINFSQLEFSDLDGLKAIDIHKLVWSTIHKLTLDFGLAEIAKDIYNGKEVELSQVQVTEVKNIIKEERAGILPFAQREILSYIDKV